MPITMKFIGNTKHVDYLTQTLAQGTQPSHAYLFVGAEHIGKRTLARAYAHALITNTQTLNFDTADYSAYSGDALICCVQITKEKKTRSIGVEQLRTSLTQLTHSPYHGTARVLIIDDAHYMSPSAQNALLKTLEEPIATSTIILVSAQPDLLLPTLHSRCTTLSFAAPTKSDIAVLNAPEDVVTLGLGRPGMITRLLADADFYEARSTVFEKVRGVASLPIHERLALAQDIATDRTRVDDFLTLLLHDMHGRSGHTQERPLFVMMEKITIAQKLLTQNVNTRLVLENLLIAL